MFAVRRSSGFVLSWEGLLLVVTQVSPRLWYLDLSGFCSPEKDCFWLWLTDSTTTVEVIFRVIDSDNEFVNDSEDNLNTGFRNVSDNQQQSYVRLDKPGRSTKHKHGLTWVQSFHCINNNLL